MNHERVKTDDKCSLCHIREANAVSPQELPSRFTYLLGVLHRG